MARRRNEGYFAEMWGQSVANIWGPQTTGGVRVMTSEEALEEREEQLEPPEELVLPHPGLLMRMVLTCLRLMAWTAVVFFLINVLVVVVNLVVRRPMVFGLIGVGVVVFLVMATLVAMGAERFFVRALGERRRMEFRDMVLVPLVAVLVLALAVCKMA